MTEALTRADIEAAVEAGCIRALNRFSPHDLETHEGTAAFSADLSYGHQSRVGAEKMKAVAKNAAIKTAVGAATAWFCYALGMALAPGLMKKLGMG